MKIKYKINSDGICLEKCEFMPPSIGSVGCRGCKYNMFNDTHNHIIECKKYNQKYRNEKINKMLEEENEQSRTSIRNY